MNRYLIIIYFVYFCLLTANAQHDMMYIMKSGVVIGKYNVNTQIDSIIFYQPPIDTISTVTDADGNVYQTVTIGTQTWMAENLNSTKYNDGTEMPNVTDNYKWRTLTTGAYCNYDNLESNAEIYGRLYNWYAVNTGKLAPKGWHVPTDEDWAILENYLIANGYNYDGTKEGNKIAKALCSKTNWESNITVGTPGRLRDNNNSTGFTAIPSGDRYYDGAYFGGIGEYCIWWSSTEYSKSYAFYRILRYNNEALNSYYGDKRNGHSVRLVRD